MKVKLALLAAIIAALFIVTGCNLSSANNFSSGTIEKNDSKDKISPEESSSKLEFTGKEIKTNATFYQDKYTVVNVKVDENAPTGIYTFDTDGLTGNTVNMYYEGNFIQAINYLWRTTVTDKVAGYYTFKFTGYLEITIRATRGSLNLYGIPEMFNGQNYVEAAAGIEGVEIKAGSTFYNDKYTIVDVIPRGAAPGLYTYDTDGYTGSVIKMYQSGTQIQKINYAWRTTVTDQAAGYYTFCFPGHMDIIVRATRGSLNLYGTPDIFNGKNYVKIRKPGLGEEITAGKTFYGDKYTIVSVMKKGVIPGYYTFTTEGNTGTKVKLYKNGIFITDINYNWRTKVTDQPAGYYTFDFPGYMKITVRATRGSLNLYGLPAIFNGLNYVNVKGCIISK